ncbi:unnamed protein product, partial [marine sediment metagenome]
IKQFLGFAGITEHDVVFQDLLEEVTSDFQNYMDRYIFINDWTEKFDIETKKEACIQLKEFPVRSVAGLTDADLAIASGDYIVYPETGQVCLDDSYFTKGRQTVEISYRAGYSVSCIPEKLRGACKKEVGERFFGREAGDLSYEKIGDYAYRRDTHEDTARHRAYGYSSYVRRVLDYFRDGAV